MTRPLTPRRRRKWIAKHGDNFVPLSVPLATKAIADLQLRIYVDLLGRCLARGSGFAKFGIVVPHRRDHANRKLFMSLLWGFWARVNRELDRIYLGESDAALPQA